MIVVSHIDAKRFTIIANEMMNEGLMSAIQTKEGLILAITQTQIVNNSKCWPQDTLLHVLLNKIKTKRAFFPLPCEKMFKIKNILQNKEK